MAAFEIIALDPVVPQLRAPGVNDTLVVNQTWNSGATTFTALEINVTNTASVSTSLLANWKVGGSSIFSFRRDGYLQIGGSTSAIVVGSIGIADGGLGQLRLYSNTASILFGAGLDAALLRDDANTLAQRNGTNAQTFRIYNTFTDASNYERGFMRWAANKLFIGAEAAGTGVPRNVQIVSNSGLLEFQDGNSQATMTSGEWLFGTRTLSGVVNIMQAGYSQMTEIADPAAGAVNTGRLYVRDNGSGKTQLCVRFATGAVQVLATEP